MQEDGCLPDGTRTVAGMDSKNPVLHLKSSRPELMEPSTVCVQTSIGPLLDVVGAPAWRPEAISVVTNSKTSHFLLALGHITAQTAFEMRKTGCVLCLYETGKALNRNLNNETARLKLKIEHDNV